MPGLCGKLKFGIQDDNILIPNKNNYTLNLQKINALKSRHSFMVAKNTRDIASYEEDNIFVIFEGVFIDDYDKNEKIAKKLYHSYVKNGELFVKDLRGSFQIILVDEREVDEKILIYSDHIASRQIFYAIEKKQVIFSPDIKMLIENIERKTINEMAMVNFLISGHFPAGQTAIEEIKVVGPGEYLSIKKEKIKIKKFFHFKIEPDLELDSYQASRELDSVLKEKIIKYWKSAKDPSILLSGGYDSQYIFYTIADSVEDTSKLITVTWGQNPDKRYADMDIARKTAKRFGTQHIEIIKKLDKWRSEYDKMFIAQSGMTDSSFYHANELTVCRKLKDIWGIKSIMRGDECLGYGPNVDSAQGALKTNHMSFPEHITGIDKWFKNENRIIERYSVFMRNLVDKYDFKSYNDLKDMLDFYERQHMNRNPLNYFKLHYLDVFSPLIDPDVLKITCKFPDNFRHHKKLFKTILENKINDELQIAKFTNLANWEKIISETGEIKKFFIEELKSLPSFLNYEFFNSITESIVTNNLKSIKVKLKELLKPLKDVNSIKSVFEAIEKRRNYNDHYFYIPVQFFIIRAIVLCRWNKIWISPD